MHEFVVGTLVEGDVFVALVGRIVTVLEAEREALADGTELHRAGPGDDLAFTDRDEASIGPVARALFCEAVAAACDEQPIGELELRPCASADPRLSALLLLLPASVELG